MDDVGVPANYREMPGFGVHTYTLINREGKVHYVKFHWLPKAGMPLLLALLYIILFSSMYVPSSWSAVMYIWLSLRLLQIYGACI